MSFLICMLHVLGLQMGFCQGCNDGCEGAKLQMPKLGSLLLVVDLFLIATHFVTSSKKLL